MKHLINLDNTYFGLRHGLSESNVQNLIVSYPEHGIPGYGLTETGKEQVKNSITQAKQNRILDKYTFIISGPFLRVKQTAEIAQEILEVKDVTYRNELIERNFGLVEKTMFDYQLIWNEDEKDPEHTLHNVETILSVRQRTRKLIEELENTHTNQTFLLVSHGDTLQILEAALKEPSSILFHRLLQPLENAEIRKLN